MERLSARLPTVDVVLGVLLVVAAVISESESANAPHPWGAVVGAAWAGSVLLRTVAPFAMVVVFGAAGVTYTTLPVHTTLLYGFIVLLVVTFSAGLRLRGRLLVVAVLLMVAAIMYSQVVTSMRPGGDTDVGDVYVSPFVLVLPVFGGVLLRRSRQQAAELRRLGAELAAEREAHGRASALAERNRIARELHDVISHSVSVMVVQAGAAEQLLPAGTPAAGQVRAIRETGREALAELRRQLGLLRPSEQALAPMPGLDDIPRLTEQMGARLVVRGDLDDVSSPGLGLAAYRVVQEALTNTRRHAVGAEVEVALVRQDDHLLIDVDDTGGVAVAERGAQQGIRGMKERVALYGGELEAGPRGPGWRVRAMLPVVDG